jgi:hypothetical protein
MREIINTPWFWMTVIVILVCIIIYCLRKTIQEWRSYKIVFKAAPGGFDELGLNTSRVIEHLNKMDKLAVLHAAKKSQFILVMNNKGYYRALSIHKDPNFNTLIPTRYIVDNPKKINTVRYFFPYVGSAVIDLNNTSKVVYE